MKLCVHGDSLFAWVTAAKLAEVGHKVTMRISGINNSFDPDRETNLVALLEKQQQAQRLQLVSLADDFEHVMYVHFIAADLHVEGIKELIISIMTHNDDEQALYLLLVSTLPIGTLDHLRDFVLSKDIELGRKHATYIIGLPLFCREGSALDDFSRPSLLLMSGKEDSHEIMVALEVLRPFVRKAKHMMIVPHRTSELIKMGINAMLATRISFMNEMAALAEKLGIDIDVVRQGLAADPRIGSDYLQAGCGFGGPSFSEDLLSFAKTLREELDTTGLIDTVLMINDSQREILFRKVWRFFAGRLAGKKIAIWGAAFKAGTASLENSVVHPLLEALWAQGCYTAVYDPMAAEALYAQYGKHPLLTIAKNAEEVVTDADALVLVTAWDEFLSPDFSTIKTLLKQPVVFDGRNIYDPEYMQEQGFRYFAIGRGEAI
ncbi:MAG TPA: nucleotide sugar dehydrogenase [Agitococcus sp.]|nr:nucleotide sugar dehydrogenase [Agitococcus sp.]